MGNSASKKAKQEQLDAAEKNYAGATSALAEREQELASAQRRLESSKAEEARLASEAETMRKKCTELDVLSKALDQEQQRQISILQTEVKLKADETVAQRRVLESRVQETDDVRRQMRQMEEKIKLVEQQNQMSSEEFQQKRKELEEGVKSREKELENAKAESATLLEKVKLLDERHQVLSEDFASAKAEAEEKLIAAKAAAAKDLSTSQSNAAEELAIAKASMSDSARNLTSVSSELASTKASLSDAQAKLFALQRTNNEAVTRSTASYEAFTATKQELKEAQEKYHTLYQAHEKQGRDLEENLSAAKKDVSEAQQKHLKLQLDHENLTSAMAVATRELAEERAEKEKLKADLAALQKHLIDAEGMRTLTMPETMISTGVVA